MKFTPLAVAGAYLIELDEHKDERGSFMRQFCCDEFGQQGIEFSIKQCNISTNRKRGTIRGLHYQAHPYPEKKLVSCLQGSCFDVVVDLRPDSPTCYQWSGVELALGSMVYVPDGCAHGFQTLEDDTVLYYQLSEVFMPEFYKGIRWNDPKIGIKWRECAEIIMNERDRSYALL